MASKVQNATMTVIYRESVKLNNVEYGNRNETKISGINEVSQRIITVPTVDTKILVFSASAAAGIFSSTDLKYARLTNLDNTNFVKLTFLSESSDTAQIDYNVKLEAGRSIMFSNTSFSGSYGQAWDGFENVNQIKGKADTAAVDLEIFLASS